MPVTFTYWPALLLLPVVCAYFWHWHRRSLTDLSSSRKRLALALRCLLAALLILAVAGLRLVRRGQSLAVVFLVDGSRSIRPDEEAAAGRYIADALKGRRPGDKAALISFARDPHTLARFGEAIDPRSLRDPGRTDATDVAEALRQARSELAGLAGVGKRVVLLSDGNENSGHALPETAELGADRILLDTVELSSPLAHEALIDKVVLPPRAKIGEPFTVRVIVTSRTPQRAVVSLSRTGEGRREARQVELQSGKNVVSFEQSASVPGFYKYSALLDAPLDTIPENNRGEGYVWVHGRPALLYVADDPAMTDFLRKSLQAENIDVSYAPPAALPTTPAALQQFDAVYLSNVRADYLSFAQMRALETACRDLGVGFGMVGGENSFGAGGYRGTPIEEALPVSLEVKQQKRLPSVAVALVIEDLEIPASVNMSIEAAKATMDLLEPIDQAGVLDCNGPGGMSLSGNGQSPGGDWRIPMQHVTDREKLKAQMQSLTDMGDPPAYDPFLTEAARVLAATDAKVKHIVLLGDGDTSYSSDFKETAALLRHIRDSGISVSTIATGADAAGVQYMAAAAFVGGGQAYVADRPQDLPRLLLKDQETFSQPPIIEEPFQPRPVAGDEILAGIDWKSAPPLLGYNVSTLKPTALVSLVSHRGDPVFAAWRFGLGRAVAFLSDDRAHWAAQWLGWPAYARFWAQTVRWSLRPYAPTDFQPQVTYAGGHGHVTVDAVSPSGEFVNGLRLIARVTPPGAASPSTGVAVRQTSPGGYEADFDTPDTGTYLVNLLQMAADGKTTTASTVLGLSLPYSPEYREIRPNRPLLQQLAAAGMGRANPAPRAVFGADRPPVWMQWDPTAWLLALALCLLPLDIAARRLAIDASDARRLLARVSHRTDARPAGAPATAELGRLLQGKERAAGSAAAQVTLPAARPAQAQAAAAARPAAPPAGAESVPVDASALAAAERPAAETAAHEPGGIGPRSDAAGEGGMSRLLAAKRRAQQRGARDKNERK